MFWSLQTQLSCSPTVSGTLEVLRPYVSLALVSSSSCCLLIIIHSLIIMFVNRNCGRNVFFFFFYKRLIACNNRSQTSPINKVLSKSDFIWLYLILEDYWALKIKVVNVIWELAFFSREPLVKHAGCSFSQLHNAGACQMVVKGTTFSGFQNKMYCLRSGLDKKNMLFYLYINISPKLNFWCVRISKVNWKKCI